MNKGRWVLAAVVATVAVSAIEAVGHGVFLKNLYLATASLWRPEAEMSKMMWMGWLSTLVCSFILVYIYHRGYEGKGSALGEGLRFGLIIGLFTAIPMTVWTYIMYPLPVNLVISWFVIGMIDMLVAGALIGLIYKKA